jgi:hypothetical protein
MANNSSGSGIDSNRFSFLLTKIPAEKNRKSWTLSLSYFVPGAGTEPESYRLPTSITFYNEKSERVDPFRLVTLYPQPDCFTNLF